MNDADLAVEATVLNLARSQSVAHRPGLDGDVSRWLFKTAFAFAATDRSGRRHVPYEMMNALRKGKLPSSYITFVHRTQEIRHIAIALLDMWPESKTRFPLTEQKHRFKFGIQYDNVIFGCAYVGWSGARFVLTPGLHEVVEIHGADQRLSDRFDELSFPTSVANTRLNYVLAALGVE